MVIATLLVYIGLFLFENIPTSLIACGIIAQVLKLKWAILCNFVLRWLIWLSSPPSPSSPSPLSLSSCLWSWWGTKLLSTKYSSSCYYRCWSTIIWHFHTLARITTLSARSVLCGAFILIQVIQSRCQLESMWSYNVPRWWRISQSASGWFPSLSLFLSRPMRTFSPPWALWRGSFPQMSSSVS